MKTIRYFKTPAALRAWLKRNHANTPELMVGFYRKSSDQASITWSEAVAEALCFGWIDGVRRKLDEQRYTIRFAPRKRGSIWSAVNIRLFKELEAAGRMTDAGRAAFAGRTAAKSRVYSYEQKSASATELSDALRRLFEKNRAAWRFFESQPAGYRRKVVWWVMSAKQDETRVRRCRQVIEASAKGMRLA